MLAIIAGAGSMPYEIASSYDGDVHIITLAGIADDKRLKQYNHTKCGIAKVGRILEIMAQHNVAKMCFAGKVVRPNFTKLLPDKRGFEVLRDIKAMKAKGDDNLLNYLISIVEKEGIEVVAPHIIAPHILVEKQQYSSVNVVNNNDIELGIKAAKQLGELDIGQSVIVSNGVVIGVEGAEGTDNLIKRCKQYADNATLVKVARPQQDSRMDLPTIGLNTVQNAHKNNISTIAVEAGSAIFIDRKQAINYATQNNISIIGV